MWAGPAKIFNPAMADKVKKWRRLQDKVFAFHITPTQASPLKGEDLLAGEGVERRIIS